MSRFAGDPKIVGKKILVNNYPMEIVGVSAAGFAGLDPASSPDIRVPIQMTPVMTPGHDDLGNRRSQWVQIFARLKPGYTVRSAQASMQPLFHQILQQEAEEPALRGISSHDRDRFLQRTALVETAATGYSGSTPAILNRAHRADVHGGPDPRNRVFERSEPVDRKSNGAAERNGGTSGYRRWEEGAGQAVADGKRAAVAGERGAGAGACRGGDTRVAEPVAGERCNTDAARRTRRANSPVQHWHGSPTALLFGVAPALQATRLDLLTTLKDLVGAVTGGSGSARFRKTAGNGAGSALVFTAHGRWVICKDASQSEEHPHRVRERRESGLVSGGSSEERLHGCPHPQLLHRCSARNSSATRREVGAYAMWPLLNGREWDLTIAVEGHQAKQGEDMQAYYNLVSPGYWQAMGIPLLRGRDFEERDRVDGGDDPQPWTVAIVNREFAEHFFPAQDPIGRLIGCCHGPGTKPSIRIVGVVENSLFGGPRDGVRRQSVSAVSGIGQSRGCDFLR